MRTIGFHQASPAANRLVARLKGTCSIEVAADGSMSSTEGSMQVTAAGDVQQDPGTLVAGPKEIVADPAAPKEDKPAEPAKEETPEEKAAREATEKEKPNDWANRDKSKDVPLSDAQKAQLDAMKDLTPEQKTAVEEFTIETNTTGDLSEASREKAAKTWGVPRAMVDQYVEGIKAANARNASNKPATPDANKAPELTADQKVAYKARMDALYARAGSKETWDQFAAWATGGGLTEAEQVELAQAIDVSPNMGVLAAEQYLQRWNETGGSKGPLDAARNAGQVRTDNQQPAVKPFANRSEEQSALNAKDDMGRPKMDVDADYRRSVEARMAVSNYNTNMEQSFFRGAGGMMGT